MTKLTLVIVIALNVVILLVPLAFLVRLVACIFSRSIRERLLIGTNTVHEIVAVWSSGKNGSNEYGAGDDLTSWK